MCGQANEKKRVSLFHNMRVLHHHLHPVLSLYKDETKTDLWLEKNQKTKYIYILVIILGLGD